MSELRAYLELIVERWKQENIPIRPGVDAASIAKFESYYFVTLPNDMREFYCTIDGMGEHYDEEGFFRFWPLKDVQPIDQYRPELAKRYPESKDYFLFFDHSIDLFMYAIRLQQNPISDTLIARLYPQDDGYLNANFKSFTEVLIRYATNPDDLL